LAIIPHHYAICGLSSRPGHRENSPRSPGKLAQVTGKARPSYRENSPRSPGKFGL